MTGPDSGWSATLNAGDNTSRTFLNLSFGGILNRIAAEPFNGSQVAQLRCNLIGFVGIARAGGHVFMGLDYRVNFSANQQHESA
jgi:hypothetical protein